jgi:hypothetical protein
VSGIVFFATEDLDGVVEFYRDVVDAEVWREQVDCTILERGSFRFAFCARDRVENCGILTFLYPDRVAVDRAHERVSAVVDADEPAVPERYDIYRFFATDPEGRTIEFQTFL